MSNPKCKPRRPLPLRLPIVAFGHQSRVGKDTAARAIERALPNVERVAFADALKATAHQLFQPYGLKPRDHYDANPVARTEPIGALEWSRDEWGVGSPTAVDVWVEFGAACRRIAPDVWVDKVLHATRLDPPGLIVISDLRFPNEFRKIKDAGGWCVRIERPDGRRVHGSDAELDDSWDWDEVLINDGALEDLEQQAVDLALRYLHGDDAERIRRLRVAAGDA